MRQDTAHFNIHLPRNVRSVHREAEIIGIIHSAWTVKFG